MTRRRFALSLAVLLAGTAPALALEEQAAAPEGNYVTGNALQGLSLDGLGPGTFSAEALTPRSPPLRILTPRQQGEAPAAGAVHYTLGNLDAGIALLSDPAEGSQGDMALTYSAALPELGATRWTVGGGLTWGGGFEQGSLGLGELAEDIPGQGSAAGLSLGLSTVLGDGLVLSGRAGAATPMLTPADDGLTLDPSFFGGVGVGYKF